MRSANIDFLGCMFHLTHTWYRKIEKLGLSKAYNNELNEIGSWLRHLFGLQYLGPNNVENQINQRSETYKFPEYLVRYYLDGEFSPIPWAKEETSQAHTTNVNAFLY